MLYNSQKVAASTAMQLCIATCYVKSRRCDVTLL